MENDSDNSTEPLSVMPPDPRHKDRRHRHYERPLKVRRVPLQHGWYWLIEGFMLWKRSPAFLSFLAFSCLIAIIVVWITPDIGGMLGSILYPGLMLGVFNGCRAIDRKRILSPALLISGFRRHAFDLLLAGFCSFIVMTAIQWSTWPIDGGKLWQELEREKLDWTVFSSPPLLYSSIVTGILSTLWLALYLFVPQLIGWWRLSVPKALIYSMRGCLFNLLPFFVYTFCYCFFIIILSALVINFFGLVAEGLGVVVCTVFILISAPALIASFYVAARDIFGFPRRRKHRQKKQAPSPDLRKR
ncbi:MAG: hypothetical protein LBE22_09050 [Azoarcus sp.]|jgi:hypothetical protein|nr:hypothetical protein [Azoarcus sp.]